MKETRTSPWRLRRSDTFTRWSPNWQWSWAAVEFSGEMTHTAESKPEVTHSGGGVQTRRGLTATDSDTSLPEVPVHPEGTDRRRRRKLKKKERKRAAKAKRDQAINLGLQERGSFSTTPASLSSATPPSTSSGSGSNQTASPAAVPVPLPTSSRSKALSMNAPPPQVTRKDSKLQTLSRAHVGGKRKSGLSRHVMQMLQKDKKKAGSSKGSLAQFLENLQ
ncbi:hypothetical protein BaRGS_00002938 [Batillaria attramentaria]|uniref:Uncharacterized protein n=1 Tax=Batillaria attramentaria TaxID=370345 RepID=A0ABD0M1T4_9CAEN